jgi:rhodanese-related sulfurtransferase
VLSPLAARKAEKLGYTKIKVFHAGLPAWKKAGRLVESNQAGIEGFIKDEMPYILIDLRSPIVVEKGHIAKAVSLPKGGLEALKDQFPKFMNAPIILYNQHGDTESAAAAFKTISDWGYKQVSILQGGLDGWQKAGLQVATGPGADKITFVRKLAPGEVDIEVFKTLIKTPSSDTIILDVRNASEAAENALPNTKNIPLDELEQRLAEIPKDKKIVLQCSTGARAEMAYSILKKAGVKAGYVKANVEFDPDKKGQYEITD